MRQLAIFDRDHPAEVELSGFRLAELRVRKKLVARIPAEFVRLYEHAFARGRMPAVVDLYVGKACGGCFLAIPPRTCADLAEIGVIVCPHCGRLVLLKDEPSDPTQH